MEVITILFIAPPHDLHYDSYMDDCPNTMYNEKSAETMDIAIITGASSGLGHEYAKTLLDQEKTNIKILVNNAGFERTGAFASMENSDILSMVELNVKGFTMIYGFSSRNA